MFNIKGDKKQEYYSYGNGLGNFNEFIGPGLGVFYSVQSEKTEKKKPENKKQY